MQKKKKKNKKKYKKVMLKIRGTRSKQKQLQHMNL